LNNEIYPFLRSFHLTNLSLSLRERAGVRELSTGVEASLTLTLSRGERESLARSGRVRKRKRIKEEK